MRRSVSSQATAVLIITLSSLSAREATSVTSDYSKEAMVLQEASTKVRFGTNGSREWRQTFSVRVQSEAAVRQFGVLAFSYSAGSEELKVEYVRVRKADGTVVETPASSIMDVATQVASIAPTYSDLRQKQIPVKALAVGDVLEYSFSGLQQHPEVPGQFWYAQYLLDQGVILSQTLEISVPKDRYVQVSSPGMKADTRDEGDQRIYTWKHPHLEASKPDDKKTSASENDPPKVQISSFKSWEEVGNWWAVLAYPQAIVTPAIDQKAKELTAGLSTDEEKARSIYKYVAMKFRYISISLGTGRYQPHNAAEVLSNQYGDCKDKHTLFAALLKAAGIQAWPALIGSGIKFDPSVPSPSLFDHVITVLPRDGKYLWLDTTAEVAPFGLLSSTIRDEQALVIPTNGKPFLARTPLDPPFTSSDSVDVKSRIDSDGTLTGHFDFQLTGDNGLLFRAAFRELAPVQWQALAQQAAYSMGYGGDVSGVSVENVEDPEKPLRYGYDYLRKKFSDWEDHQITLPTPPLGFGPGPEAATPKESFPAGARGRSTYRATVQLPAGFSMELPKDVALTTPFADYSAHYSEKDGAVTAERKLTIKQAKVSLDEWAEYQKFSKDLQADQTTFLKVSESTGDHAAVSQTDMEAGRLMRLAYAALNAQNVNGARDLLKQVESLNPKQPELWGMYGYIAMISRNNSVAIADTRKEVALFPKEINSYRQLTSLLIQEGRKDEAIEAWKTAQAAQPQDPTVAVELAHLLGDAKRYSEILSVLEKPIANEPGNYKLKCLRVEALLRGGQKEQGIAEAQEISKATSSTEVLNDLAYVMGDTGLAAGAATEWAQKVVRQTEQEAAKANLDKFEQEDLKNVHSLASEWDTLGWVYFGLNDLAMAEKYVNASWLLDPSASVADHLGQIYDKQGKHSAAIHTWRLGLAVDNGSQNVKERLRKAGAPIVEPVAARTPGKVPSLSAVEELGSLRTIKVPSLAKQTGSAEFFLLISKDGIEDVRGIGSGEPIRGAAQAISTAKFDFQLPDSGPEKIIRRGILSCSAYTSPSCQLTLLYPSTVVVSPVQAKR